MKKQLIIGLCATLISLLTVACAEGDAKFDGSAHADEVLQWRADRLAALLKPYGYLNQTGLFWLSEGSYSFGSDESNDLVFSGHAAPHIGSFTVDESGISMAVEAGVNVHHGDELVSSIAMTADSGEQPVIVTHESLAWNAVDREGRLGIRLRDFELPFVSEFGPLEYFDIDPTLRVEATLMRYPEPIVARTDTVIEGLEYRPESPGVVQFEIGGEQMQLEAFSAGDRLFYVFGDKTNRDATYGAGRFLYSSTPGDDGKTVLDFNKAYSPPCAFNDFSTCPVASPRNTLSVRVEAGEIYDPSLH